MERGGGGGVDRAARGGRWTDAPREPWTRVEPGSGGRARRPSPAPGVGGWAVPRVHEPQTCRVSRCRCYCRLFLFFSIRPQARLVPRPGSGPGPTRPVRAGSHQPSSHDSPEASSSEPNLPTLPLSYTGQTPAPSRRNVTSEDAEPPQPLNARAAPVLRLPLPDLQPPRRRHGNF